jgi:hypothetical protein
MQPEIDVENGEAHRNDRRDSLRSDPVGRSVSHLQLGGICMRKLTTVRRLTVLGLAAVGAMLLVSGNQAQARPQYLKAFAAKYENLAAQAKKVKCGICHFGKSKKNRNDYGKAVMKNIGKKNQKNVAVIKGALTKAEKMKNAKGKTFGELIKAGKLPGTAPSK